MDDVCYPERAHFTDAGLDLKTSETVTLQPGDVEKVGTAIKVEIPPGHVGLIFPRSGLASKKGIVLRNTVGVIDSDYRGEIICGLHNQGSFEYTVEYGERIAQMVVVPCLIGDFLEVEHNQLSNTERGEGGFGHTG